MLGALGQLVRDGVGTQATEMYCHSDGAHDVGTSGGHIVPVCDVPFVKHEKHEQKVRR